jgi:hypothetical protein
MSGQQEQQRNHRQQQDQREQRSEPSPGGLDGFADSAGAVLVSHGTYLERLPVVGMTVGEVRGRSQDRLDIHPEATALVDGNPVDDSTRLHAGQTLMFVRPSGEKGALGRRRPTKRTSATGSTVTIEADQASVTLPEGESVSVTLSELIERLGTSAAGAATRNADVVLPDGVKGLLPIPGGCIAVYQRPPSIFNFRWIAPGSEAAYGPEASYRQVRLGLPYMIVLGVFERARGSVPQLGNRNECFFLNQPLDIGGLDTELCFPALLNCSRFPDEPRHPLSWICTQHLERSTRGSRSFEQSLRSGIGALLHHLLETGFNLSSEHHELNSWFTESVSAGIDPRIASVESWEEATQADPLFALEVPWLRTGKTLRQVADRIAEAKGRVKAISTADDIARLIVNAQPRQKRSA